VAVGGGTAGSSRPGNRGWGGCCAGIASGLCVRVWRGGTAGAAVRDMSGDAGRCDAGSPRRPAQEVAVVAGVVLEVCAGGV
jgi:hypothetical protein